MIVHRVFYKNIDISEKLCYNNKKQYVILRKDITYERTYNRTRQ